MAKRLRDNISSRYVEAGNRLAPKDAPRRVVAYVESYDDVFFWRTVLSPFENRRLRFEVMLPSRNARLERGKKAALMSLVAGRTGNGMIACVDADYDYLMQGATTDSKAVLDSPYVLHTYAYAIENLQCYAPALHDICVAATLNDNLRFDFEGYLRAYSEAIFPLFVWNIWYHEGHGQGTFTMSDFLTTVHTKQVYLPDYERTIASLRHKVDVRVRHLQQLNPDARASWQQTKTRIKSLGVTPATTYLYIQGHHVMDHVVGPLLKRLCATLVHEREQEIRSQSKHGVQRNNELSCYASSTTDALLMLRKGTAYTAAEQYRSIVADVQRFVSSIDTAKTGE